MAHRAGTGDAPIPGLITSRRNPAYRLKPRPKENTGQAPGAAQKWKEQAHKAAASRGRRRSRSRSRPKSPARTEEEERRSRERREEEERDRREREDEAARKKKLEDEELQKKRWAEQEAKWAEERRAREEQRRVEERRQADRQKKLRGAFAMEDEDDNEEEDQERARELAERQRRKAQVAASAAPALLSSTASGSGPVVALAPALLGPPAQAQPFTSGSPEDAVRLRASLADPGAPRQHAPGEVAEHFRRLSEMKRRFRRAEFGGPDRRREPSRSKSRDKYNSVWIRPGDKAEKEKEKRR